MRFVLALLALFAAPGAAAFLIGLPTATTVVEFHNRFLDHYFMTGDWLEIAAIEAGAAGPGWRRTGYTFIAPMPGNTGARPCAACLPVERFYGTPGLGPNSHFYTAGEDEAGGLRRPGSGWTYEKTAFWTMVPVANGQCPAFTATVFRLYNGRWMHNDSNHRYVTREHVRADMMARGWADEGARFCVTSAAEVAFKSFDVDIPLSTRILPSARCEDESQGGGACLAVNNLPVPSTRNGPYGYETNEIWAAMTGLHAIEVYSPGPGHGAPPESIADGIFVNGTEKWVGLHIETRGRDASSLASLNPLYQLRTAPGAAVDERFFPFAPQDLPAAAELSIRFSLVVRRISVFDEASHAYGHPTLEFIDARSGEHLYFTVLAYGRPSGGDYLALDVGTGKVIVGTEFRDSTPYGRSIGAAALATPPGFEGHARGEFDFRLAREDFQRVIDAARRLNPALSRDPSDYLVDNFHFNNEVVGNAEIGAALGHFSLRLMPRR